MLLVDIKFSQLIFVPVKMFYWDYQLIELSRLTLQNLQ